MKQLVACPACARQYDASGRSVGSRFRCHCGDVVVVPEPKSHEARVVRCSACGAPRGGAEPSCGFCGSSFTLHERDLQTICPRCFARVSDRARYCPECGIHITPEESTTEETESLAGRRDCPVCDDRQLHSRRLGSAEVAVFECGGCAGLWLGADTFSRLEDVARQDAGSGIGVGIDGVEGAVSRTVQVQEGPLYRPCVVCGALMHRLNYGKRSGVIVDLCKQHGVWFDADELQRIVAWIRSGGLERSKARDAEIEREEERRKRLEIPLDLPSTDGPGGWGSTRSGWLDAYDAGDLLVDLAGGIGRLLFRRG